MMLISEIRELIAQGEGPKVEFKRDDLRPEKLAKEIVSFANMNGGRILLGVADDGAIAGIGRENLQAWIMDTVIGRYIYPAIIPDYEEAGIEEKTIAVLTIPMGTAKPYVVKHHDHTDIYVRYGNVSRLADRAQQARLFASGGLVSVERFPIHGSAIGELDERRYREYFTDILGDKGLDDKGISDWQRLLTNRSFLVAEGKSLSCSYFAYALFAKDPQRRLPQAGVRVTVYHSQDKDYQTMLDEHLNGPLVELRGHDPDGSPVEIALHNRAIDILKPFISREKLENGTRERHWDYPRDVLRELFVNAFIHRDWTKQNHVRIVCYVDRLEIISPGDLPNGMTVEKIKYGEQSQRNPFCTRIFRDYGYLEDQGMGIRRTVIPLMKKETGREPDFDSTEERFKVTLWRRLNQRSVHDRAKRERVAAEEQ